MPIKGAVPTYYAFTGLTDAVDEVSAFKGSAQFITNFIFDRISRGAVVPRPGVQALTTPTSNAQYTGQGVVSCALMVGNLIYGMIAQTSFSGKDAPFVYNITTGTFATVTNVSNALLPATQPTTGDWVTPTMDVIGQYVVVTHPGYTATPGAAATANATVTSGAVSAITPVKQGNGYISAPVVQIVDPLGIGTGATATANLTGGAVTSITVNTGGTGYSSVTPPVITLIGGQTPVFGWFDLTTPGTTKWNAGNTATNALPVIPTVVRQFFGRAYFFSKNNATPSDILNPLNVTNAELADTLTFGDTTPVIGACGLPIGTATQGVLQALLVFKQKAIFQITGDPSINTLAVNGLTNSVGSNAPNTFAAMPEGVAFMATDGLRLVNLLGQVPFLNSDIVGPFSYAETPSRACGAYGNTTYRISVTTDFKQSSFTTNEYWYDERVQRWNGPHTFPFNVLVTDGQTFYGFVNSIPGVLFQSEVVNLQSSIYTDNGSAYNCQATSTALEEPIEAVVKQAVEGTIELSATSGNSTYVLQAQDDEGNVLNTASVSVENGAGLWGSGLWGTMLWQASKVSSHVFTVPWTAPVVYKKLVVQVTVPAAQLVAVKRFMNRSQPTGYTNLAGQ